MSVQKLTKQLKRDLKANPKKAGLLALLGGVAVWFWLPLVMPAKEETPMTSPTAAVAAPTLAPATAAAALSAPVAERRWQDLAQWIEQDPRMQPVGVTAASVVDRDPFEPKVEAAVAVVDAPQVEVAPPKRRVTADDLKRLVLTSTFISGKRRVALINDEVFEVGSQFRMTPELVFEVADVQPNRVVLSCDAERYVLELKGDQ